MYLLPRVKFPWVCPSLVQPSEAGFAWKAGVCLLGQSVAGGPEGFIWRWGGEEVRGGPDVFLPQHPLWRKVCPLGGWSLKSRQGAVLEITRLEFRRRLWLSFRVKG